MWQKLTDQLLAIIVTAALVIIAAFYIHAQTVKELTAQQEAALAPLREQNDALKAQSEENRQQIAATNKMLTDAISKREADLFRTDEEIDKLNSQRMDALAEAIAKKVQPYNPLPKSPEEAERMQNEQVDKVSSRMVEKIQPILAQMASDQHLTQSSIDDYSRRISDQISGVLSDEMAKNQQLNNNLQQTQAVAQDSIALTHELVALYMDATKNSGIFTRLLALPADIVTDAATGSVMTSSDRKKKEQEYIDKMNDLQKRLQDIRAENPSSAPAQAPAPAPDAAPTPKS